VSEPLVIVGNGMAAARLVDELAKVALWLHSFTVGAPLSFLDHHLRCGDSVLGAWARPTVDALKARGALFHTGVIAGVERVAKLMAEIEETTDNDISEVVESKTKFGEIEEETGPVGSFFSLLTAEKLMGIFDAAVYENAAKSGVYVQFRAQRVDPGRGRL